MQHDDEPSHARTTTEQQLLGEGVLRLSDVEPPLTSSPPTGQLLAEPIDDGPRLTTAHQQPETDSAASAIVPESRGKWRPVGVLVDGGDGPGRAGLGLGRDFLFCFICSIFQQKKRWFHRRL
uniref:(northern house mosquito) hypothetical protein n=1 Tax=Culex pipiens TaxID=7175 RepID=A0A8D8K3K5_CULPI